MSFAVQKYTGAVTRLALPRINAANANGAGSFPSCGNFSSKASPQNNLLGVRVGVGALVKQMTQTK
jgi:hypothetical protein